MTFLNQTDPDLINRRLEQMLMPQWNGRIYLASEEGATQPGLHAGTHSCPATFVTVIKGQARFQIRQNKTLTTLTLNPGDVLLRLRNTWITLMPQSDYLSMGGRIELDRFLLFFSQPVAASQSIRRPKRYVDIHKTPYHVCRSANQRCVGHLVNALGDLALTEQTAPLLRHVTCAILQSVHEAIHHPVVITETSKAQTTFAAACSYLDEHCCQAISRDDVARALQIHPTHVSRLFSQLSDKSFNQHLVQARLKRAHALLTDPTLTISQIAAMCGFNAASYFTRLYRQQYGQGPFEWRTRQFTRTTT